MCCLSEWQAVVVWLAFQQVYRSRGTASKEARIAPDSETILIQGTFSVVGVSETVKAKSWDWTNLGWDKLTLRKLVRF